MSSYTVINATGKSRKHRRSITSSRLVPRYWLEDLDSQILQFLDAYYNWHQEQGADSVLFDVEESISLQHAKPEFVKLMREEYAAAFPSNLNIDSKFLILYMKEFLSAKGTEAALKFLFKLIWNDDITISYPKQQIFKLSDGTWDGSTYKKKGSFASDVFVLQDGEYFQEYSYSILTSVVANDFMPIVRRVAHPAGMFVTGQLVSFTDPTGVIGDLLFSQSGNINYDHPDYESSSFFIEPFILGYQTGTTIADLRERYGDTITTEMLNDLVRAHDMTLYVKLKEVVFTTTF